MDSCLRPRLLNEQGKEFQNPRKISIGILMDSFSQPRPKDLTIQTEENATFHRQVNSTGDGENMQGVLHAYKLKQSEGPEQETSPWFCSRSFHQKLPVSAPTPTLYTSEPIAETQTRIAATKSGSAIGVEKISFATLRSMREEDMEEPQTTKAETRSSETLRLKLWEILGTVASPNQEHGDLNIEPKNLTLLQKNEERVAFAKPRQNSDTIETDSECPDLIAGRPMTRSLIRKRASGRLKASKMETAQSSYHKKAKQEANNYSFLEEGFSRRLHYAVSGGSFTFTRKRCKRWSPEMKATIMCSDVLENPGQNQPVKSRGSRRPSQEKSWSLGNAGKYDKEFHQNRDDGFIEPKSVALEVDSHQVHLKGSAEHLRDMVYSPKFQDNVGEADQTLDNHCPIVQEPNELYLPDSSANKMEKPVEDSSPCSPQKTKLGEEVDGSPAKILSNKEGSQSFLSSNYVKSDADLNSSGFSERFEKLSPTKPEPLVEEEPEGRLSLSSYEDSDFDGAEKGSPAKGLGKSTLIFPEIPTVDKYGFMLHLNKKLQYEETVKASEPILFEKGSFLESGNNLQPQLDSDEGDGITSAISLFAFAMERVKSKMKSMVRKRSAEILTSVAEGIKLQLQTVESQIEADMMKLASINKSKRKLLERRYEELEGQFSVIHARFKDEVNRHLQDCISVVEGLDAHHMELRGTAEKQSVAHRKLLLQAEEAIEMKLNNAQRRLTEIRELAREKMFQLTSAVANCL